MSDPVIKINKWRETFENANSRKLKQLVFYQAPSGCNSSGFIELATEQGQDGLIALGVFSALCQLMATQPKETRGSFIKSNGDPMTPKRLSVLTHIDEAVMIRSLKLLGNDGVSWVSADHLPNASQTDSTSIPKSTARGEESIGDKRRGELAPTRINWSSADYWQNISINDHEQWAQAYPACDVQLQLKRMTEWLLSNPVKAHRKEWRRFITNWLSKQQDRGGDARSNPTGSKIVDKVSIPEKMMIEAYQAAWPVKEFPGMYPMRDNLPFWQMTDDDRWRMIEAHEPLRKLLKMDAGLTVL